MEVIHSMSECLTDCELCNTINGLVRVPNKIATQFKEKDVGKVVDSYIEDAKKEVEEEKNRLKGQDWKDD